MRVLSILALIALTACQTPGALPPREGAIIDTTISAVLADPDAFHGKTIRVRGEIDDCIGGECSICNPKLLSDARRNDSCLAIEFVSKNLTAFEMMNVLYRFSDLSAVGVFYATCLAGKNYELPPAQRRPGQIICLDNGTTFFVERVDDVFARKPATQGHFYLNLNEPLVASGPADAREIVQAFEKSWPSETIKTLSSHVVLQGPNDDPITVLCMCTEDNCDSRWPTRRQELILTPNNPFYCVYAEKTDGQWRFPHAEPFIPLYESGGMFPVYRP